MEGVRYRTLPEKTADALSDYLYQENYRVGQKLPNEL
jgi:DNA-binding FadR family transcriptional regulator